MVFEPQGIAALPALFLCGFTIRHAFNKIAGLWFWSRKALRLHPRFFFADTQSAIHSIKWLFYGFGAARHCGSTRPLIKLHFVFRRHLLNLLLRNLVRVRAVVVFFYSHYKNGVAKRGRHFEIRLHLPIHRKGVC